MQILLTHGEVGVAVMNLIAERVSVAEGESIHVLLTDDGATVSILPEGEQPDESGDEPNTQASGGTDRPRKTRRTKAQIEADNKAEAERLAAQKEAGAVTGNDAVSTETPVVETRIVQAEVAGETTQEQQDPGTDAVGETQVDPQPEVAAAVVVVEEQEQEPDPQPEVQTQAAAVVAEEPAETGAAAPSAAISLFANLRKPQNG